MTKIIRNLICLGAFVLGSSPAFAFVSPVSVGILPPLEFPPSDFNVAGVRLSVIYGDHRNIYGLDLGVLGNITQQEFRGVAIAGLFNFTHGDTTAVITQAAGVWNWNTNKTNVVGVQFASLLNLNEAASTIEGLELAMINIAPYTDVYGLQVGVYNRALDVHGFQIGVVNVSDSLHGVQIGLVNFNRKGTIYVSPILNAGF